MVGNRDQERYKNAFFAYSDIKESSMQKLLLLYPSLGLCYTLTSLCLMDIVDISIEFDKKASLLI